jgi:2-alkyl-3-oxoalkanoate reductase
MRIFLAGGTGAIGRPLIAQAVRRGHVVHATSRSPRGAEVIRGMGATPVILDALDAGAVADAVSRAAPDAIAHEMTALSGKPDLRHFDRWFADTNRLRTEGTRHLLAAAQAAKVKLFVAQSYAGWPTAPGPGALSTEDDPLDTRPARSQRETLAAIRALEQMVTTAPLTGIVLRYGSLYGPGASEEMVSLVKQRKLPIIGDGSGITSWLHVDDAAGATLAALEASAAGIYNVVDDDPAPMREWLPAMAAAVGARPPRRVPVWLARLLAGEAVVRIMRGTRGISNARAKSVFRGAPVWPSWRDGFRRALV